MTPPHPTDSAPRPLLRAALLLDALGLALFALACAAQLTTLTEGLGPYDEPIVLLNATLLGEGAAPYRDFYSNYPPGVFWLVLAAWKLFGATVMVERWVGTATHLVLALACGGLAGLALRRRFAWVPAGLVMLWLSRIGTVPHAYLVGLGFVVGALALLVLAERHRVRGLWLASGACLGAGTWFRHDLALYVGGLLFLFLAGWWAWRRKRLEPWQGRALGWWCVGAAAAAVVLWAPVFARAGFGQVVNDILLDQARYTMPGRVLPMPPLTLRAPPAPPYAVSAALPVCLHQMHEGAAVLMGLGPLLALLGVLFARRLGLHRLALALLAAVSLAVFPQALGRSDLQHVVFAVVPSLMLCWVLAEAAAEKLGRWLPALALLPVAALLVYPARGQLFRPAPPPTVGGLEAPAARGLPGGPYRNALVQAIQARTAPGERIFVGLTDHRRVYLNELDIYFLADRRGSNRYMQFDPGIVNRLDVQEEMARELDQQGTRLLVLSELFQGVTEPNEVQKVGSDYLDRYIKERYSWVGQVGPYHLMMRKRTAPPPAPNEDGEPRLEMMEGE